MVELQTLREAALALEGAEGRLKDSIVSMENTFKATFAGIVSTVQEIKSGIYFVLAIMGSVFAGSAALAGAAYWQLQAGVSSLQSAQTGTNLKLESVIGELQKINTR